MQLDFSELFLCGDVNYSSDDLPLGALLSYIGFTPDTEMEELGRYISGSMIEAAFYIDRYARPTLATRGIMGNRVNAVWLSPDHRRLLQDLQNFGTVRKSIESGDMRYHFVAGYLISDSGIFCTLTLTAQTAYALKKYGGDALRNLYLNRFTDRNNPWYGATYYSETQGGSDLGMCTTTAIETEGRWRLTGHEKYFASNAGIADGAIVTARPEGAPPGARGIAVYFVPAKRTDGEDNYIVRRLKDKLGTIAVPTGEVELEGSEGMLLGEKGKGIYYAMEILSISRIDDALAAAGIARKALWEAYRFACKRSAFGKSIISHPLLARDFIELESDLEAALAVSLVAAKHFSEGSNSTPPYDDGYNFARMLTHIAKNMASETGAAVTKYALEIMGGRGFLSEFPMEKFHRDELVTSIWEGTSNIQALDLLELMTKKRTHEILYRTLGGIVSRCRDSELKVALTDALERTRLEVGEMLRSDVSDFYGKDILRALGIVTAAVYFQDAADSPAGETLKPMARTYIERHMLNRRADPELLERAVSLEWMEAGR